MILNVLCQSPVIQGRTPAEAIGETIALAELCDTLGYNRFWVTEHHNTHSFASATPEVLMAHIAGRTQHMRIGAGGFMMSHYSPLKIAETANLLEALYPGRIDIGMGRAGGGDAMTNRALSSFGDIDVFEKYNKLRAWIGNPSPSHRPQPRIMASPSISTRPELWVLGTSVSSAQYAAKHGLPYSFAMFINDEQVNDAVQHYFTHYTPSKEYPEPQLNLGVFVMCAETEDEAARAATVAEAWVVDMMMHQQDKAFPTEQEASSRTWTPAEQMLVSYRRRSAIVGTPEVVHAKLRELSERFRATELTIVTITDDQSKRMRSYELLAQFMSVPTPS